MVQRNGAPARCNALRLIAVALAGGALGTLGAAVGSSPGAGAASRVAGAGRSTVWLCRPGQAGDPCTFDTASTSVTAGGATSTATAGPASTARRFDCFYVYPTVSTEPGNNADLAVQRAERAAAVTQASRFSQVCNVWAPMYRQATSSALARGAAVDPTVIATAYDSLLSAWRDYLAHDNHGRPIVFIGHSQGAAMLIKLLHDQVDPSAHLRKLLVSALILGGNVQVAAGRDAGGSFRNIPTCASASQTGCVVAYSTFGSPPPAGAFFGRPGQGVSLQSGQTARSGQQVACVNPATFSAQVGPLQPYFLSSTSRTPGVTVTTPWVSYPDLYTAQCEQRDGASWLQVTTTSQPGDARPTVSAILGPSWGYHVDDVSLALGDLVTEVGHEEAAYR